MGTISGNVRNTVSDLVTNWRRLGDEGVSAGERIRQAFNDSFDQIAADFISSGVSNIVSVGLRGAGALLTGGASEAIRGNTGEGFFGTLGGIVRDVFGFQAGGSVILGGRPGVDSNTLFTDTGRPVARFSAGERLDFTPISRSSARSGSGTTVVYNISLGDINASGSDSAQASRIGRRVNEGIADAVVEITNRTRTNSPLD